MVMMRSPWFWKTRLTLMLFCFLLSSVLTRPLYSQNETTTNQQLAFAPQQAKPKSPLENDDKTKPARPPAVEIVRTIEDGGGYGQELHRVTITGIARTAAGDPIKDADIYVACHGRILPNDYRQPRGHTQTDETGYFELKDVQLHVVRERPNPLPKPAEGKFCIFGTKDGFGFTWHESRIYRPDTRPQQAETTDRNDEVTARAFYLNEPIAVDLIFEPSAKLKGRITDKQGNPLANTKIQLGIVDDIRTHRKESRWSCRFLGNENHPVEQPVSFHVISCLPATFRETRTNDKGEYEFTQLRRDTSYFASIDPGPAFSPYNFRLATTPEHNTERGTVAAGYTGEFNREFDAPRDVTVKVVDEKTKQPLANVLVTARPSRQIIRVGNQARSDSQGNAKLQLQPGKYELVAEPAADLPFCFQSQSFSISEKPDDIERTIELKPAATVILRAVSAETGEPIPHVRFHYETTDSSEQFPVTTQTVYVDHPTTNASGEIQAFMAPGSRRFVVAEPLNLAQADGSRSALMELKAGELTQVVFKLSQPQFLPTDLPSQNPQPDPDSIYPVDLQLKWHEQAELLRLSHLQVHTDKSMLVRKPIDTEALLKDLRALDPYQVPDIDKLLSKYHSEKLYCSEIFLTSSGQMHHQIRNFQSEDAGGNLRSTLPYPDSVIFKDHWGMLRYSKSNNQASATRSQWLHVASPTDFCDWPSLRRYRAPKPKPDSEKPEVTIQQQGTRTIYEGTHNTLTFRRVFDQETGFIFENSAGQASRGSERVSFFFAPQKLSNGLILPRFSINWTLSNGIPRSIQIHEIKQIEVFDQLPADAFAVPLPPGALLSDTRDESPRAAQTGPRRRRYPSTIPGPVSDLAAYLQRHPRPSHQVEQKIHYGRRAPEIKPAKWVTSKGEAPAPDLKGKVVLVEFWGTRCGPCVAQLPEVQAAARYYADQPFVLIGLHDSHISVDELQQYAEKQDLQYQLAIDRHATEKGWFGKTMQDYGVRGIPHAAVLDQKGNAVFVGDFKRALQAVDRLLKQAESDQKATSSR